MYYLFSSTGGLELQYTGHHQDRDFRQLPTIPWASPRTPGTWNTARLQDRKKSTIKGIVLNKK